MPVTSMINPIISGRGSRTKRKKHRHQIDRTVEPHAEDKAERAADGESTLGGTSAVRPPAAARARLRATNSTPADSAHRPTVPVT